MHGPLGLTDIQKEMVKYAQMHGYSEEEVLIVLAKAKAQKETRDLRDKIGESIRNIVEKSLIELFCHRCGSFKMERVSYGLEDLKREGIMEDNVVSIVEQLCNRCDTPLQFEYMYDTGMSAYY